MKKLFPALLLSSIALAACAAPYPDDYYDDYYYDRYERITTVMTTTVTAMASITMTTTSNTKFTAIRLSNKNARKSCGYSNDAATASMKSKPTTVAAAPY